VGSRKPLDLARHTICEFPRPTYSLYRTRMISIWSKARFRLRAMTWEEARTRMRQAIGKRMDMLKYRAGLLQFPEVPRRTPSHAGDFFFSAEDLQDRIRLLRTHCGSQVQRIVQEGEDICRHQFRLLGYDQVKYGREIDWHLDAVNGIKAPAKPYYQIPFLDFAVVGDHKVTWELNRHQHLITLAKAWLLTGDDKYVAKLVQHWSAWREENPFPLGINWASSLEVAFRSLSWLWVRFLLARCPIVPATFQRDLVRALATNARYIERYLSTYFSPNTHLLGEAVGLFFIGTLCPEIPDASRWQGAGWEILMDEAQRQVLDDGVYFEQSLYYHVYALDFFLHAKLLGACNGIATSARFDVIVENMLEVLHVLSQSGPPHGFGDDDGGRLFDPKRNCCEHLTDPLAVGALLFERNDLFAETPLTEEAIWLFGERANALHSEPQRNHRIKAASFTSGGIYVLAGCGPAREQLVVDAGSLGAGRAGHGHADALSAVVSLGGRHWLVDAGSFRYVSAGNERNWFRGTRAHNTVTVDNVDQAEPDEQFGWSSLPAVGADRWLAGETFTFFSGSHNGYIRLPDPVLHRRVVFHVHDRFWLVRDLLEGREPHIVEVNWNFASDLRVQRIGGAFVALPQSGSDKATRLSLIPVEDPKWKSIIERTDISPAYGAKQSAPVIRMSGKPDLPAECAVLIAPLQGLQEEPGRLTSIVGTNSGPPGIRGYRYDKDGTAHYMIFSAGRKWMWGAIASDAGLLYCLMLNGALIHCILCDASFASFSGRLIFEHSQKIERLEWLNVAGERRVFASDDGSGTSFVENSFQGCDFAVELS